MSEQTPSPSVPEESTDATAEQTAVAPPEGRAATARRVGLPVFIASVVFALLLGGVAGAAITGPDRDDRPGRHGPGMRLDRDEFRPGHPGGPRGQWGGKEMREQRREMMRHLREQHRLWHQQMDQQKAKKDKAGKQPAPETATPKAPAEG